jgi:hypothetical protein
MPSKIFCYVDESGQDTMGELFVVSVVITAETRDILSRKLEEVEARSKKGKRKWTKTRIQQRIAYIEEILLIDELKGCLRYSVYHHTTEYMMRTVLATAQAITTYVDGDYKATVFVDGLPHSRTKWFGAELRRLYVRTEKVRGVRDEESEPLMRLADALAGFVRAALTDDGEFLALLKRAKSDEFVHES